MPDKNAIWAPWRIDYIRGIDTPEQEDCFLCAAWNAPAEDDERLVLHRTERGMILLNRYPYTNGHLLVAMGSHVADLPELDQADRAELMELTTLAERALLTALNPQGVNIGINIGRCAGAGLPGHLHMHLVPRWFGDTNFMSVVGQVRVIPQALEQIHEELRKVLPTVLEEQAAANGR
jgi:ATP adenylyltransferase